MGVCIYCLLVNLVCFRPIHFLHFSYLSPPLLIFSFKNRRTPFPGRMSLVFSKLSQKTGLGKRLWNDLFCVKWDVNPQLNWLNLQMRNNSAGFITDEHEMQKTDKHIKNERAAALITGASHRNDPTDKWYTSHKCTEDIQHICPPRYIHTCVPHQWANSVKSTK